MVRSFAVAFVFLEVRVISGVTGWEKLGPIVWVCLAFSILAADIVLQLEELRRSRPLARKAHAVTQ